MNGVLTRTLLFVLGPVTALVMFAAVVVIATFLTNREYREPYRAPAATVDATPRAEGLAAERAAAEAAARTPVTPALTTRAVSTPVVSAPDTTEFPPRHRKGPAV